jgi:predicted HD superfamily hydrolase involved in NAD metabolism
VTIVTFEQAEEMVSERLGKKAAAHSRRVAEQAETLASAYGVDTAAACLAGLLHDWDRQRSDSELLEAADASGIVVTDADAVQPHLLHARTGAEAVRAQLPQLPEAVFSAISRHTVGSADMSELDMVIYIADMIEPGRDYPGVDELREGVGQVSLGELFARCYQQSMLHLVSARKRIHPDTVAVWNHLVAGGAR